MGKYKYDLFCSVERDNKVQWPNSIELTISEVLEPIVSDVACKIELIKENLWKHWYPQEHMQYVQRDENGENDSYISNNRQK